MIKIIDEQKNITLTRSEYQQYLNEWRNFCKFHVNPPSFEDFVESKINYGKQLLTE